MADSFLDLIHQHGDKLYNVAYRLAGNEPDASDLVQEALARAYRHRDRYDAARPFDAWVIQILKNIFLDGVRRYGHKHTVSLDAPSPAEDAQWTEILPGSDPDPVENLLQEERDRLIQRALDSLPVDYRTAITLCDVEQMSYDEISRVMDCPIGTVRSRIHQARLLLRKAFERLQMKGDDQRVQA